MVNRVILGGHCTRDTVQIATQGKAMARMRLATNAVWRDADGERQEATEYHSIVLFGRLAEVAQQYCAKGRAVYLEGRLRTRDFVDSAGVRRFSTDIIADTIRLLGSGRRADAEPQSDGEPDGALEVAEAAPGGGGRGGGRPHERPPPLSARSHRGHSWRDRAHGTSAAFTLVS
jgi:single-strand DNA-binding protein